MAAVTVTTEQTKVYRGDGDGGSPENFTEITNVKSVGSAGQTRAQIDITNLRSTAREYRTALKDGQEMTLTIQYNGADATHVALKDDLDRGTAWNYRLELADGEIWDFSALVTSWLVEIDLDNVLMLTVGLKPTGDILISRS